MLNFFNKGEPVNVIIDDRLPMSHLGTPINSHMSRYGAWWMPILEKAYSKFDVFYANINGGTPVQALRDLTGMPVVRHGIEELKENLFDKVMWADAHDWIITAGCNKEEYGLHPGHAYTISGAAMVTDEKGKKWKLFKMRNPWARETYNGPWNDSYEGWSAPIRKKLKFVD